MSTAQRQPSNNCLSTVDIFFLSCLPSTNLSVPFASLHVLSVFSVRCFACDKRLHGDNSFAVVCLNVVYINICMQH